jgi:hypothetical protein
MVANPSVPERLFQRLDVAAEQLSVVARDARADCLGRQRLADRRGGLELPMPLFSELAGI